MAATLSAPSSVLSKAMSSNLDDPQASNNRARLLAKTTAHHFLGNITPHLPEYVQLSRADHHAQGCTILTITSEADHTVHNVASNAMDKPTIYLEWAPANAPDAPHLRFLGFQCSEFALPIRSKDTNLHFNFFDRPGFSRPRWVFPLLIFNDYSKEAALLAPLDAFHEQVLAISPAKHDLPPNTNVGGGVLRWGWSGDIDQVPVRFTTSLVLLTGKSPNNLLKWWGSMILERARCNPRSAYADVSTQKLSFWTDNGAAYWYRREHGMDLPTTLANTIQFLDREHVPITAVELDSWFYNHEIPRKITDVGYCDQVPPTGMLRWEPRVDALGSGGIHQLRERLGNRPLILHSRHISSRSSYVSKQADPDNPSDPSASPRNGDHGEFDSSWWVDGCRAHPTGPELFHCWMRQAADWGATTYEQDWLVEIWMGMRQLRAVPGRIAAWQHALNDAADKNGISLIWCMATPADMALAASLSRVVAVRTCDDYRYAVDPSILWRWHLTTSCIIRSLQLWPFKDVFFSSPAACEDKVSIDGDPNAELEALLSALSAGPVGIGDRIGHTNREIVMRTCRADGILIKPDTPLAALDCTLWNDPEENPLLWADTVSGDWRYLVVIHAGCKQEGPSDSVAVCGQLDVTGADGEPRLIYDWRSRRAMVASKVSVSLCVHDWKLFVICPIMQDGDGQAYAVIGDVDVYATMGSRRMRLNTGTESSRALKSIDVCGSPGEVVSFGTWSAGDDNVQVTPVTVPPRAWTRMVHGADGWVESILQ